jgi:predicted site-specific integrase-resolvase
MAARILDDYATPAQLAYELGINPITLMRWHLARKGPPRTKMGRRILYRRESVAQWLASQQERPVVVRRGGR